MHPYIFIQNIAFQKSKKKKKKKTREVHGLNLAPIHLATLV